MKTLPAFKNHEIYSFMIDLVEDCVKAYKIDVAYDIKSLYKSVLLGNNQIFWGVRKCGTGMGYANSEYLDYYKQNNMIVLFNFSNLKIIDGEIYGDIAMVDYVEKYENKWYNNTGEMTHWYHVDDEYDDFYFEVRKIARSFIKDSND